MKSHLLVTAAMLGAAVATPVESLAAERTMHSMTARESQAARRRHVGVARGRHRLAQLAAADGRRLARQGRAHRLLDLHLHQLAAHSTLRSLLGGKVQGSGTGGDRRPYP